MVLLELFVLLAMVGGPAFIVLRFARNKYLHSAMYLHRVQELNRKKMEKEGLFRCREHNKVFGRKELVRRGRVEYCPECYRMHMIDRGDVVVTDLSDLLGK